MRPPAETAFDRSIVTAFCAYLTGRTIFLTVAGKKWSIGQRYGAAAAHDLTLHALIVPLFFLGAVYEAFEIIYLVRYFI